MDVEDSSARRRNVGARGPKTLGFMVAIVAQLLCGEMDSCKVNN